MAQLPPVYLPAEFLQLTQEIMPESLSMDDFIAICQQPLRRSIRVNTLKISVDEFMALVSRYQWQLDPIPWCAEGFWLTQEEHELSVRPGNTPEHLSGLFYIQEASSMLPVSALFAHAQQPNLLLDMAAAPGSKTTQLAARMGNKGGIVANEYSASRVKVLHANLSRCGIHNTALTHFDGRVFGAAIPESFDAILLDAPCSGEGVVRKDRDAMQNWSLESVNSIAATQRELIDSAFHALKPNGTLVYSTCTLNRQENQDICHWLSETYPDAVSIISLHDLFSGAEKAVTKEGFLHVFPQIYDSEGFFVACFRKTGSIPALEKPRYNLGKFPFSPVLAKDQVKIRQEAAKCGLVWEDECQLWQRDKELWLFPHSVIPLLNQIRFSRIGIKLAECFPKGFRWQHEAIIALAKPDTSKSVQLDPDLLAAWYQGRDLYPDSMPPQDECLLTYHSYPVGLAKRIGSRLKNNLPRELVRDGLTFDL